CQHRRALPTSPTGECNLWVPPWRTHTKNQKYLPAGTVRRRRVGWRPATPQFVVRACATPPEETFLSGNRMRSKSCREQPWVAKLPKIVVLANRDFWRAQSPKYTCAPFVSFLQSVLILLALF